MTTREADSYSCASMKRLLAVGAATLAAACAQTPRTPGPADASAPRAAPAAAPEDLSGPLELARLYDVAFRENPKLAAARHRWAASIEDIPIETTLPEPMAEYMFGGSPDEPGSTHELGVRQEIPFPTKIVGRGEVAEAAVRVARAEFEIAVRDVLVEIAEAYYELWSLEASREVTVENQDLLGKLVTHVTSEHAAGRAQLAEVERARAQLAQLEYDLVTIEEFGAVRRTKLNALLSRPPGAPIGRPAAPAAPGGVAIDLATLHAETERHRLELRRDEARIAQAEREVELARQDYYPDLTLGFEYETVTGREEEDEEYRGVVGVALPVWVPKYQAGIRRALAERSAAEADRRATRNDAATVVAERYFEMRNSGRLVRLYAETLLPQATRSMATAREWYEAGGGSYSHFLETQQVVLAYRLALVRAIADYYQGLVRLEAAVGRPLPEIVQPLAGSSP